MTEEPNAAGMDDLESAQPKRPQRPAILVFTQAVLLLQAFVALFATLVLWSFARNDFIDIDPWVALVGGVVLMLALFYISSKQAKRWARIAGWVLQVPMLVAVVLEPAVAVIGAIFLILWIMALHIGGRIDRERKEREQAAQGEPTDSDADPA